MKSIEVSQQELDTILAALRYYVCYRDLDSEEEIEIARDNGPGLNDDEIDDLCERINI